MLQINLKNIYQEEKVKLKIADALSNKKNIIIADEPTSNLDKKALEFWKICLKGMREHYY